MQQLEHPIDFDAIAKANTGVAAFAERLQPIQPQAYASQKDMTAGGFTKGPIPDPWMVRASRLSSKAFQVGFLIWRAAGKLGKHTFALSTKCTLEFGIDVDSKGRAVRHLEKAGLIKVERRTRRSPVITILKAEPLPECERDIEEA